MPATQISFSDFALAAQQAAIPCAPPVIDAALALVAQPLAADSGECIPVGAVLTGRRGCSFELRDDYRGGFVCDGLIGSASGSGMDAPERSPSGSHSSYVCGSGDSWAFLVVNGFNASRGCY